MNRIVIIFNSLMVVTATAIVIALVVSRMAMDETPAQATPTAALGSIAPTANNSLFEPPQLQAASPTLVPTASPTPMPTVRAEPTSIDPPAEATSVPALAGATSVSAPAIGPVSATANATAGQFTEYTVQRGESLAAIAKRFNVTVRDIITANTIANPDAVPVGTVLRIPNK